MYRNKTAYRKKIMVVFTLIFLMTGVLIGRLVYLMVFRSEYYVEQAKDLHERERDIKAARGQILDRNGVVLAANRTVCTISVIHSQVTDPEMVIRVLTKELGIDEETVRKRVEKVSSIERVRTNVDKSVGDAIRAYGLAGVKVDEDYKRYYPYDTLASKVLGFTGGDNQGIIGLEVKYDDYLQGTNGKILTLTDARGVEIENAGESRLDPVDGNNLVISIDYNIQMYAEQVATKVMEQKQADHVSILIMNPQNGEIYAMANVPEFNLNEPFVLNYDVGTDMDAAKKQELLNQMWRNPCINDTYEPGSTFKIITASAALEQGVVTLNDNFFCPGYKIVEDRRIRCHKAGGHGAENFEQGLMNSCKQVVVKKQLEEKFEREKTTLVFDVPLIYNVNDKKSLRRTEMTKRMNDTEERKRQILRTATDLFAKKGYHGVGIDEIAEACGVVRGTVLRYFGSKQELYKEVLYGRGNPSGEYIIAACEDTSIPVTEILDRIITLTGQQFESTINYVGSEMKQEEFMQNFDVIRLPVYRRLKECMVKIIERGNREGIFRVEDPNMRAYSIVFAVFGVGESLESRQVMEAEMHEIIRRMLDL